MKKLFLSLVICVSSLLFSQISLGTGSTTVGTAPVSTYYGYSYVQQIFKKGEINAAGAGSISGLKFYLDPSADLTNSADWTIYLGHTTESSFANDSSWIPVSQLTQVFTGSVTNNSGVVTINFATPFSYNDTDNLVVAAIQSTPQYDMNNYDEAFYVYPSGVDSGMYFKDDNVLPTAQNPPIGNRVNYHSVITFEGLTPNPVPSCPNVISPVNNTVWMTSVPTFSWMAANSATSYLVSVGTSAGGTDVLNNQSVTGTTYTMSTALTTGTPYYLTVKAVSAAGTSAGCTSTTFQVMPPPPANDECANAITINMGTGTTCNSSTVYSTLAATDSNIPNSICYGIPDDDIWFKFVATSTSAILSFNNITEIGDSYGSLGYNIFSGACGTLSEVTCDDGSSSFSNIIYGLTVGETYYIRAYDDSGSQSYTSFSMCINALPAAPANDDCASAISLPVSSSIDCANPTAGTTISATDSGLPNATCNGDPDDDVWYKFVATSTQQIVRISNVSGVGGSYLSPEFEVLSGSCGSLVPVICDDSGFGVASGLTVGQTYYVRVYSSLTNVYINYDICISTMPPVPVNDDCSGALQVASFPYTHTQTDAIADTNNSGFITACDDGNNNGMNDGVWYKFTGNGYPMTIEVTVPPGTGFDPEIGLLTGSCGTFTCEEYADNAGLNGTETINFTSVAGTVYYVNVGHYSGLTDNLEGAFTINITTTGPNLATGETITKSNGIKIHPNPFSDVLNISDVDKVKSVSIMDTSGKVVRSFDKAEAQLRLSDLNSGMYIILLNMKDGSKQTIKAIKK